MPGPKQSTVREIASAKVNLYLHIRGRRPDGYHDLDSAIVFTEFGDVVDVSPADRLILRREGPYAASLDSDPAEDLCYRAADRLAAALARSPDICVNLTKNIPVAAGVGGGSADAAAVMRGLCRLWGVSATDPAVMSVAEGLGADVPVCLLSGAAHVAGIGDIITPLAGMPVLDIVLVNPRVELSTARVFTALAAGSVLSGMAVPPVRIPDIETLVHETRNDLEPPARKLCPAVPDVLAALGRQPGCALARMSGSGATCFGLFETAQACDTAAAEISGSYPDWWVCRTRTRAG